MRGDRRGSLFHACGHRARPQTRAARACGGYSRSQIWSAHRLHEDCGGPRGTRAPAQPAQRLSALDLTRNRKDGRTLMNAVAKTSPSLKGYARRDGRKGIRNVVAVGYLVGGAPPLSRPLLPKSGARDVPPLGFPCCFPDKKFLQMMQRLCTHPNVGAVLLVSLGCEGFNREQLRRTIAASGRPVDLLVIQQSGGTTRTLNAGLEIVRKMRAELAKQTAVPMGVDELI